MSDVEEPKRYHGESKRKRMIRSQRAAQQAQEADDDELRPPSKKKFQQMVVGWILTIIFGVSSVGFLSVLRNPSALRQNDNKAADPKAFKNERLKDIEKRLAEHPDDPSLHFEAAQLYRELQDSQRMQEQLAATLKVDPSHAEALRQLPIILLREGKISEARSLLEKGLDAETADLNRRNAERAKDEPEMTADARLRALLVHCCVLEGKKSTERAEELTREGLELNPHDFAEQVTQSAYLLVLSNKKKEGLGILDLTLRQLRKGPQDELSKDVTKALAQARTQLATFKLSSAPVPKPGKAESGKDKVSPATEPPASPAVTETASPSPAASTTPEPSASASAEPEAKASAKPDQDKGDKASASPEADTASPAATPSSSPSKRED